MNTQLLRTASRSLAAAALLALSALPSYAQEKPAAHQDYEAPKVGKLEVVGTTPTTISLKWTPATDNKTPQNKLRYVLWMNFLDNFSATEFDLGTNVTSRTIRELSPDLDYSFNLLVIDEADNISYYYPIGQELKIVADSQGESKITAEAATIESVGDTSIALKWKPATSDKSAPENVTYQVYWSTKSNMEWSNLMVGDTLVNKTSYTITGLSPTAEYLVKVKARDEMGNTVEMLNTKITTLPDKEEPIIREFTISQLRHNSVRLKWSAEDNCTPVHQLHYEAYFSAEDNVADYAYTAKRGEKEMEVRWLKPDTKYEVTLYVYPHDRGGYYGKKKLTFTTPPVPDYEAPKASEWLVGEATDKSLRLLWMAATDNKTAQGQLRYRVGWKAKGEKEWTYSAVNPADWKKGITNFVIEDLKANTEYDVELFVMDEAENITSYGEKKGRTAVPNAIESVKAVQNKTAEVYGLDGTLRQEGVEEQPIGVYIMEGKKVIKP